MADDAGALLVRSGLVTSSALEEARAKAENLGGTLGEQLVAAGSVSDDDLTEFYKKRLLVPQVNPNSLARLPAKVVAVIPSNMAIELRAIPVSLDADNNLTIAMSDPSDRRAVDEIATYTGSYVVRAVATQMQIAWCLAHYYGHVTHLGQRLLQQREEAPTPAAPRTRGVTGQVNAMRHRGLVPGEANIASRTTEPEIEAQPDPDAPKPRPRSVSGEIRVPQRRAPSIRPPLPEDSGQIAVPEVPADLDSGPVVTIEEGPIDDDDEPEIEVRADPTPLPVPKRKRPAEPDPPELAARAGEVQLATGTPIKAITFDEPAIIIADDFQDEVNPRPKRITNENTSPLEASVQVSGELSSREEKGRPDDANAPSVFVELGDEESQPIMLHQTRPTDDDATRIAIQAAPPSEIVDEKSDVVVLETRKKPSQPPPNRHRNTVVGIGAVTAATRARSIDSAAPTEELDDIPTAARAAVDNDPTRVDAMAVPARDDDTSDDHVAAPPRPGSARDTSEIAIVPAPSRATPPPSGQVKLDNVRRAPTRHDDDDEEDDASDVAHHDLADKPTMVMSALELDEVIPGRVSQAIPAHLTPKPRGKIDWDPTDEGWGPPGTTIPPPLLGDIPLSDDQSGMIPLPDMDSAPLIVAPPVPPERAVRAQSSSEEGLSRALEAATNRVLELIHTLDHTTTRDQVVAVMIAHLAETHQRAGFFAARGGELSLFAITPRVPTMPWQTLRLDRPSTLQDVVGTRLPYRGPMLDAVSREFLTATLGACPPEILLVPVSVRERVVGVLFGDNRTKHTFDDQLALAARAAGMALERILKAKRGDA